MSPTCSQTMAIKIWHHPLRPIRVSVCRTHRSARTDRRRLIRPSRSICPLRPTSVYRRRPVAKSIATTVRPVTTILNRCQKRKDKNLKSNELLSWVSFSMNEIRKNSKLAIKTKVTYHSPQMMQSSNWKRCTKSLSSAIRICSIGPSAEICQRNSS